MPTKAAAAAEAFKAEIQKKIQDLVTEFAEGKISREQFNMIYMRYSGRLEIADHAIMSGNPDAIQIAMGGPPTITVKEAFKGKAIGLGIYHSKSGTMIDTLGNFDVPVALISPTLNDFSIMMEAKRWVEPRVEKVNLESWLLFAPGRFSTIVTLFHNEPAQRQIGEMKRLHHDFEEANRAFLERESVDKTKLAYPFLSFVQQKLKKS
jgi:hypothetical protein